MSLTEFNHTIISDVKEASLAKSISVFPNPATDFINIEIDEKAKPATLQISNSAGETVYASVLNFGKLTISTKPYKAGHYFLTVNSKIGTVTKNLVIE